MILNKVYLKSTFSIHLKKKTYVQYPTLTSKLGNANKWNETAHIAK